MSLIQVLEKREKAFRLQMDGIQFWVMKRWYRMDGSLTPSGINSFESAKDKLKNKALRYESDRELIPIKIVWDNLKSVGIDLEFTYQHPQFSNTKKLRVFFPKSQVQKNCIPRWLFRRSVSERMRSFFKSPSNWVPAYGIDYPDKADFRRVYNLI